MTRRLFAAFSHYRLRALTLNRRHLPDRGAASELAARMQSFETAVHMQAEAFDLSKETDELGATVAKDRVHVHDFHATILHLLGFHHTRLTYRRACRDDRLTDVLGRVKELLASQTGGGRKL